MKRKTPLTARSVILSVLLGTEPPVLPVSLLVSTTELFGIAAGTTRTALSRMVANGELAAESGRYALAADRLLHRQTRQAESRRGTTTPWTPENGWHQAVVVSQGQRPAAERALLRQRLLDRRFGELREGTWLRPANLDLPRPEEDGSSNELEWFCTFPVGDPVHLAARLWPLDEWARKAQMLREDLGQLTGPLEEGQREVLAEGFVLSADVLRHFQADPLLPPALLPTGWPGDELRADYERYDRAYRAVLREWFSQHRG